jgi:hypothetical protein
VNAPFVSHRASRTRDSLDQRRSRRLKVFLPTEVLLDDRSVRAHVLDISTLGSLLHTGTVPEAGSVVGLDLDGCSHRARIVWVGSGRVGVVFDTELTGDQVARIIAR